MKRVILAEKPSQAQAYAESFGKFSKKDGYIILNPSNDIITWGFGHLVELASPEEYRDKRKVYTLNNSIEGYLSPYGGIAIKR